jgi:hypothetical protein
MAAQSGLAERLAPVASRILDTSGEPERVRELVLKSFSDAMRRGAGEA